MSKHSQGYIINGGVLEHVAVVEKILGRRLPPGAEVHHMNHDRADNRPENLVVCPSRAYHSLLHLRERALDACGDASKRKCVYCKEFDYPASMAVRDKGAKGIEYRHRACHARAQAKRKARG